MQKVAENLFELYKSKVGDQTLFNGVHNFTILNNSLAWTQKKYFEKWFETTIPCISFSVAKGTSSTYWVTETHFNSISREVFLKYWNDQSVITELEEGRQAYVAQIETLYRELTEERIKAMPAVEIAESLQAINDAEGYTNCNGWYAFGFEKEFVKSMLAEAGSSISNERLDEIWETLTLPASLSFDKRSALKVFDMVDRDVSLDDLTTQTQYFYAGFGGSLDHATAKKKVQEEYLQYATAEDRAHIRQEIAEELQAKQSAYAAWLETLSAEEQRLAVYTKHIIKLRDSLRDTLSMTITAIYRYVKIVSEELSIPVSLLDFATFEEMLKGPAFISSIQTDLEKRQTGGFALFINYDDGEVYVEYDADTNKTKMEHLFTTQHGLAIGSDIREIKGNIGSKGLVTGKVKIIIDPYNDSHKMEEGDILVTGMTRPEFVPLMRMAKGIITDEGGITCHAAIVSREMKKPCIIGTKNATKVLRDGDMVELDANTGIVKIL